MFFLSRLSLPEEQRYRAWLRIVGVALLFNLAIAIAIWVLFLTQLPRFAADIPLHYNIYFGIDSFGSKYQLLAMPIFSTAVLAINFLIILYLANKEKIFTYFLIGVTVLVQLLVFIGGTAIIILNRNRL